LRPRAAAPPARAGRREPRSPALARIGLLAALLAAAGGAGADEGLNGFPLDGLAVPRAHLHTAGVPADGVPRVDAPGFASLEEARAWAGPETPVLCVRVGDDARAYPIHLLDHHMIVNDRFGERAVLVSYDPLAASPRAYSAGSADAGDAVRFGFSGVLHLGGMALYRRSDRVLFSQFDGRRLTGAPGPDLEPMEVRQLPLGVWAERHPGTRVLERPRLREIDYRYSPYAAYWISQSHPPVPHEDDRFHPKEVLLGVVGESGQRAYLGSVLTAAGGRIVDVFEGHKLRIAYDGETATFDYRAPEGVRPVDAYWFAWKARHPDTEVWSAETAEP